MNIHAYKSAERIERKEKLIFQKLAANVLKKIKKVF